VSNQIAIRDEPDVIGYFRAGIQPLVDALRDAPDDLEAMTFLKDSPPPRVFWSRRQAHENTVHMVDAIAAEFGRAPEASEAAIALDVALDGIDEILCGFFSRGKSKLFDGTTYHVLVAPTDADRRWLAHVDERMTVARLDGTDAAAGVTISGTAAGIYLTLWNRGELVTVSGDDDLLARWRATQRVRWS
jgi:hypothetical protein